MPIADIWSVSLNPLELMLRGSTVYWFLFLIFRFMLRRDTGSLGTADILLLVLIADASQNAMAGEYKTVLDGFILVGTIAGWNYLIDWAGFRFPALRRFFELPPVVLVKHGQLQKRNLRRELITVEELMGRLREQGVDKLHDVKFARMESDGDISVIHEDRKRGPT